MFSTAVGHFVKAVGKDTFVPVPSLDVADNVKLLQVVVKKNRYWFWQKPTYKPTDFALNNLLQGEGDVTLPSTTHVLVSDYNPSYKIAVNGKFGAALCKELIHLEIDADDEISLKVKFGKVDKTEVDDIPKLVKALESVRLNIENSYVKQIQKTANKTLCLIVGVATLTKESSLESELKIDNGGEVASGKTKLSVDDDKIRSFSIPAGTPIAYNVCELLVTKSGALQLVLVEGFRGGFGAEDVVDAPMITAVPDESSLVLFKGFLSMKAEERKAFTDVILEVTSSPRLIEPLLMQLKAAYRCINHVRNSRCDVTLNSLKRSIVSKTDTWQSVLKTAGFRFLDDGKVGYPAENHDRLQSCRGLFRALIELEDEELSALRKCDATLAKPLHNLLHDAILKLPLKKDNVRFCQIFENPDNPALLLLKELQFKFNGPIIEAPQENVYGVQAAQRAVFALWGDADFI